MAKEKKSEPRFFNVYAWMGFDHIKESTSNLSAYAKSLFKTKTVVKGESVTFDQAVFDHHITPEDLRFHLQTAKYYFIFFIIVTLLLAGYTLFELFSFYIMNAFICAALTAYAGVSAFKQHFKIFQIKQRLSAPTFNQWKRYAWQSLKEWRW